MSHVLSAEAPLRHLPSCSQDIPRQADHAASKTFYTWKIDLQSVHEEVAANSMKGMCNLVDRADAEIKKRPQVRNLTFKQCNLS